MKKLYLILVLAFFSLVLIGNIIYLSYFVKQVEVRKIYLEVADKRSFFEEGALFFGYGYQGSIADRFSNIYLTNGYEYPLIVSVKITGNISPYVAVTDNDFRLNAGEKKILMYKADIPQDIKQGLYSGETRVVFTRAIN